MTKISVEPYTLSTKSNTFGIVNASASSSRKMDPESAIELDDTQLKICRDIMSKNFFVSCLVGGAGTGKTFVVKRVVEFAQKKGINFIILAPTGRAAANTDVGMTIALLGVISFACCGYLQLGVAYCVASMTVLSIGASMTFGPLSRFVIESSHAPMASRVAVQSLATSICGVFASTLVTLVNNMTFFYVSIPMTAAVMASICLFATATLPQLAE